MGKVPINRKQELNVTFFEKDLPSGTLKCEKRYHETRPGKTILYNRCRISPTGACGFKKHGTETCPLIRSGLY